MVSKSLDRIQLYKKFHPSVPESCHTNELMNSTTMKLRLYDHHQTIPSHM